MKSIKKTCDEDSKKKINSWVWTPHHPNHPSNPEKDITSNNRIWEREACPKWSASLVNKWDTLVATVLRNTMGNQPKPKPLHLNQGKKKPPWKEPTHVGGESDEVKKLILWYYKQCGRTRIFLTPEPNGLGKAFCCNPVYILHFHSMKVLISIWTSYSKADLQCLVDREPPTTSYTQDLYKEWNSEHGNSPHSRNSTTLTTPQTGRKHHPLHQPISRNRRNEKGDEIPGLRHRKRGCHPGLSLAHSVQTQIQLDTWNNQHPLSPYSSTQSQPH